MMLVVLDEDRRIRRKTKYEARLGRTRGTVVKLHPHLRLVFLCASKPSCIACPACRHPSTAHRNAMAAGSA
eukprot:7496855-Prorocentrum_lima.AAC.1